MRVFIGEFMFKRLLGIFFAFFAFIFLTRNIVAQEKVVNIHIFTRDTCGHCAAEKAFLAQLQKQEDIEVFEYELSRRESQELLAKVSRQFKVGVSAVPFTVIGEEYFSGFLDEQTSGQVIMQMVEKARGEDQRDMIGEVVGLEVAEEIDLVDETKEGGGVVPDSFNLPLVGEIQTRDLSLPVFTFVVALLDGFNPCAMWVLMFLIARLIVMENRKRMWAIGITFIAASAVVYFLFLAAWLNLFLFIGFVIWVRIIVGLVALGSGGYYLYDYVTNKDAACKVTGGERKKNIFEKIDEVTHRKKFLMVILGVIGLAFAVNLIELVCSAGLPAVYTQVLSLSNLPRWQYYLYLIFYIFIFMMDDLLVLVIAMRTLEAVGLQTKYARFSHLLGGVIMLGIGLALFFKPELLTWGIN